MSLSANCGTLYTVPKPWTHSSNLALILPHLARWQQPTNQWQQRIKNAQHATCKLLISICFARCDICQCKCVQVCLSLYLYLCLCVCECLCVQLQQRVVAFLLAMLSISLARGLDDSLKSFLLPTLFLLASAAGFNGLFYWQLVVNIYLALVIFPAAPNSRRRRSPVSPVRMCQRPILATQKRKNAEKIKPRELAKFTRPTCNPCRQIPDLTPACLPPSCVCTYPTPHSRLPTPYSPSRSQFLATPSRLLCHFI